MPVAPGTFDLSLTPDDSYATCEHCVLLVAYDEAEVPRRAFFQQSGTMTLTGFNPDEPWVVSGSVADTRLVEVTQNLDGSWNVVPDGLCFELPEWSFDTAVVDGGPCERVEDCPNELFQICDVETHTCQPAECDLFGDLLLCDPGYRCMSQYGALIDRVEAGPATGACYAQCTPAGPGARGDCAAGETRFALDATQQHGICLEAGGAAIGAACTLPDVGTGCADGGLCAGDPPSCHAICDYLGGDIACPADAYCSSLNLCEPLAVGDVAPVGALCAPGAATLTDCGPEGEAFRGLCFRLFETVDDATCERTCETASPDCPTGTSCLGVSTPMSACASIRGRAAMGRSICWAARSATTAIRNREMAAAPIAPRPSSAPCARWPTSSRRARRWSTATKAGPPATLRSATRSSPRRSRPSASCRRPWATSRCGCRASCPSA
jgi:hypothetical protein